MLLVDGTYILNSEKVKVRVINRHLVSSKEMATYNQIMNRNTYFISLLISYSNHMEHIPYIYIYIYIYIYNNVALCNKVPGNDMSVIVIKGNDQL